MKKFVYPVAFMALTAAMIGAFATDNDMHMFPMLMAWEVCLALWIFPPRSEASAQGKAAFYSIIAFGLVSVTLSYALSVLIPIYAEEWGMDAHPNDAQGILYPIVNDGRENCLIGSLLYLIYFGISLAQRIRGALTSHPGS